MGKDGMECPAHCPVNCGMEEMMCPGGEDPNGCMMPETCIPSKGTILIFNLAVLRLIIILGPMGKDGVECPAHCPMHCGMDEIMCPGGEDFNGCMRPDHCISKGSECPNP